MKFGDVCNINRKTQTYDIHSWIMLMQVWGYTEARLPHVKLPEARH